MMIKCEPGGSARVQRPDTTAFWYLFIKPLQRTETQTQTTQGAMLGAAEKLYVSPMMGENCASFSASYGYGGPAAAYCALYGTAVYNNAECHRSVRSSLSGGEAQDLLGRGKGGFHL